MSSHIILQFKSSKKIWSIDFQQSSDSTEERNIFFFFETNGRKPTGYSCGEKNEPLPLPLRMPPQNSNH